MGTSILVLSKSEIPMQILRSMLPHDQYPIILFCSGIVAARQLLLKRSIDLLIIDMPLTEESGLRFAQEIAARSTPGLLLLMNSSFYHQLAARMEEAGIPVLAKPLSKQALYQSVRILCTLQRRISRYQQETLTLQDKMKEIQIINQAKWLLVDHCGFSEDKAHHYLLKQAMDQCCSKYEAAMQIIRKYK